MARAVWRFVARHPFEIAANAVVAAVTVAVSVVFSNPMLLVIVPLVILAFFMCAMLGGG